MYTIKEHQQGSSIYYSKISNYNNSRKSQFSNVTYNKIIQKKDEYWIMYNSDFQPISESFAFLNQIQHPYYSVKKRVKHSKNYTKTKLTALKLLYTYMELFDLTIEELDDNEIERLILFLRGDSMKGHMYSFDLITQREDASINRYLSVFKAYVKYLNLESHAFYEEGNYTKYIFRENENGEVGNETESLNVYTVQKNKHTLKEYRDDFEVSSYISLEDFDKISKIIEKNWTYAEQTLCTLLISTGLRLGEALGITDEDITELFGQPVILIRNRVSDQDFQNAKTCINVYSTRTYGSSRYENPVDGTHVIVISKDIENMLIDYINKAHYSPNKKYMNRIKEYASADTVDPNQYCGQNFYIFLNSWGKPLSQDTWNKRLKIIFKEAGIPTDVLKKKDGLSHRFRHGYGTILSKTMNLDPKTIKDQMRHRKFKTSEIYLKPTRKESVIQKSNIQSDVYKNLIKNLEEK